MIYIEHCTCSRSRDPSAYHVIKGTPLIYFQYIAMYNKLETVT